MIPVKIVDPEKVAWQGDASQVVFAIGDGLVGIRTGHADAAFAVQPCLAKITTSEGTEVKLFLSAGVARVQDGALTVVADSAETPAQIDRRRAEEALQRAKDRLAKGTREIDFDRARLALARAIHRLQLVDHPI